MLNVGLSARGRGGNGGRLKPVHVVDWEPGTRGAAALGVMAAGAQRPRPPVPSTLLGAASFEPGCREIEAVAVAA